MSTRTKVAAVAAALSAGGALAAIGPASPAVAYYSPPLFLEVQVGSTATLVTRGAAVDVPVEITCAADYAYLSVNVSQRVGGQIVQGSSGTSVYCSGRGEQHLIRVQPNPGGKGFAKGSAIVSADLFGCVWSCGEETDSEIVQINR
jgi:hypothetical protein